MRRRAALGVIASAAAWTVGAHTDDRASARSPLYGTSLREGEAALARGDAETATAAFERAAQMVHAAESELGLVRAAMLRGAYSQALAFCAHTAGAHTDAPAAAALYAWLLRVGGQTRIADDVLVQALQRAPDDDVLRAARDALAQDWPSAKGVLREGPARTAPEAWSAEGDLPPREARVVCSGVLIDGNRVVVPAAVMPSLASRRAWVRNGLGGSTPATVEEDAVDRASPLAVLRLAVGLPTGVAGFAPRDPFAGSPGFAVEYAIDRTGMPAWPLLWQGFLGGQAERGARQLGIDVPPGGQGGGPVLDAAGRVAGVMVPGGGHPVFIPRSAWPQRLTVGSAAASQPGSSPGPVVPLALDQAYENALRVTVQVLVLATDR